MTTTTDVVNRALQKIGTRTTVTSTELANSSSNEAIQANLILEADRDQLLRMAPWNCSTNVANLVYITSVPGTPENLSTNVEVWAKGLPSPPWLYEYQYPVDCLRPLKIIPQVTVGFLSGVPITTAITGGAAQTWMGPAVKFKVEVDQFYPVTGAVCVVPGSGYVLGEIITLAGTVTGQVPIGAPVQLRVTGLAGSGVTTVAVVNQVSGSATPQGGSYFLPQSGTIAQGSSNGSGTGAAFTLTFGSQGDQRVILTNQENAIVTYIRQVVDPNVMDPLFLDAWSSILSARLAIALTGDKALANTKIQEANQSVIEARKADGNEGLTMNNVTPDWIRTRGIYFPFTSGGLPGMGFDWGNLFPSY